MDKLAEDLQKLTEDNLLTVVQMIHEKKAEDTYTKNDVERKFSPTLSVTLEASANACCRRRIPRRSLHAA